MKISMLLYEDMNPLDAVGPYEVLATVPGWEVSCVGKRRGSVRDEKGALSLGVDLAFDEAHAAELVLVPGGRGSRPLMKDEEVLAWLREADARSRWTVSVCTGSLVLGAAGLLEGRRATTNWMYLETLRDLGAEPVEGRWVEDGKVITAAGVTAGIDMALHLVAREVGAEAAQAIQLAIEYDPQPPFDCGSPGKAPEAIVELVRAYETGDASAAGR